MSSEQLFMVIGVVVVVLALVIWNVRRSANKKAKIVIPAHESVSTVPQLPEVQSSQPKKLNLRKAISSWIPLLNSKSKDTSAWEALLIGSDLGPRLTQQILQGLEKTEVEPKIYLKEVLSNWILGAEAQGEPWKMAKPWVVFMVGVNGVGKTTTLSKLGHFFKKSGLDVGVVAADTFRKAAIEQLERGCQKAGVDFFSVAGAGDESEGADPSAVIFDGLKKFASKDIILVDTSGRLHTKKNLMEELKKMKRVAEKSIPGSPHAVWMIIDSTLGQNAVAQGRAFHEALGLTGLILTKIDGLSRGGTVFQLFQELRVPIWFLGVGEGIEDLISFKPSNFIEELFDQEAASF